jgi:hypothetical protein
MHNRWVKPIEERLSDFNWWYANTSRHQIMTVCNTEVSAQAKFLQELFPTIPHKAFRTLYPEIR